MRSVLQGVPALSIFVYAGFADGLMDTYGLGGFAAVSLVWAAVCGIMVGLSYLFEDHFYGRGRK